MAFGQEQNTGVVNLPGVYQDPESKAILEVSNPAGADALARLNWKKIGEYGELDNILAKKPVEASKPTEVAPAHQPENINLKG